MSLTDIERRGGRRKHGGTTAEFPPVLFVLLFLCFFPFLDMLALAVFYGAGYTLNAAQLREAALLKHTDARDPDGVVLRTIPENWRTSGIGRFAKVEGPIATNITYADLGEEQTVLVETRMTVRPFLAIPFLPGIPGLSAPVSFTFQGERPLEDVTNAPE